MGELSQARCRSQLEFGVDYEQTRFNAVVMAFDLHEDVTHSNPALITNTIYVFNLITLNKAFKLIVFVCWNHFFLSIALRSFAEF